MRFSVVQRVDYLQGDRPTFNYSTNLSARGLFLRNAKELELGQELELQLHLKSREEPLPIRGVVRRQVTSGNEVGAGIEFTAKQDKAIAEIRTFLDTELVSKLEASVKRSLTSASNVVQLASYYMEVGRRDEGLDLCRRGVQANPNNQQLYESVVEILLPDVEGSGVDGWPLLAELEDLIERGLSLGRSDILAAARERTREFRSVIDRRKKERAEREAEARRQQAEAEAQQLRERMVKEAQDKARKDLQAAKKALEAEYREQNERASKEHAEQQKALHHQKKALDGAQATLEATQRDLGKREEKILQRERALDERESAAQEKIKQGRAQLKEEGKALEAQSVELERLRTELAEEQKHQARELAKRDKDLQRRAEEVGAAEKIAESLQSAQHERNQLKRQLKQVGDELEAAQQAVRGHEASAHALEAKVQGLGTELAELRQSHDEQLGAARGEAEVLKKQLSELRSTNEKTESLLVGAQEELEVLATRQERLLELEKLEASLDAERRELEARAAAQVEQAGGIDAAKAALHRDQAAAEAVQEAESRRLSEERDGLEVERRAVSQGRETLVAERRALAEECDALVAERRELSDGRDALEVERHTLSEARDALEAERAALRSEADAAESASRAELETTRARLAAAQAALAEHRDGMQRLETRVSELDAELQTTRGSATRAQAQERELGERLAVAVVERDTATHELERTRGELATLRTLHGTAGGELEQVRAVRAELEQQLDGLRRELKEAREARRADLERAERIAEARVDEVRGEVASLAADKVALGERLARLKREKEALFDKLADMRLQGAGAGAPIGAAPALGAGHEPELMPDADVESLEAPWLARARSSLEQYLRVWQAAASTARDGAAAHLRRVPGWMRWAGLGLAVAATLSTLAALLWPSSPEPVRSQPRVDAIAGEVESARALPLVPVVEPPAVPEASTPEESATAHAGLAPAPESEVEPRPEVVQTAATVQLPASPGRPSARAARESAARRAQMPPKPARVQGSPQKATADDLFDAAFDE